jgi:hypothetical protein
MLRYRFEWLFSMTLQPGRRGVNSSLMDQLKRARVDGGREVIVLDRGEDAKLKAFVSTVKAALKNITDERARAKSLAVLVADRLGGVRDDIVAACEAGAYTRPRFSST